LLFYEKKYDFLGMGLSNVEYSVEPDMRRLRKFGLSNHDWSIIERSISASLNTITTTDRSLSLERYPYVVFPKMLSVGEVTKLIINIKVNPPSGSIEPLKIFANKYQQFVPLVISISLQEPRVIELIDNDNAIIHIPVTPIDSKPIEFSFRAKKEGYQTILLEFYNPQQQMYVGQLTIKTQIISTTDKAEQHSATRYDLWNINPANLSVSSQQMILDNLTLEIRESNKYGQYQFDFYVLSSDINDQDYPRKYITSLPLKREPEQEIHAIIHDIENMIKYPLDLEESLSRKGMNLYDSLFPEEVKDKYWNIKEKIRSIHIFSEEPWIPWEILKPWRNTDGGDYFLCEQHSFTRWPIRPYNNYYSATQEFQINKAEMIVPTDTKLINALEEVRWITNFAQREGFKLNVNNTVDDLFNILDFGYFDLLHISAHGKYDSGEPLLSYISIEEGRADFRAESIVGPKVKQTFGLSNPMVFLNACQSGSQGYSLTGIGGWAQQFIKAGACAFIGTLWSVTDAEARQFAEDLYSQLCKPINLAQAVQKARNSSRNPGDISRLAYVLFAPPSLSLSFNCNKKG